VTSDQPRTIHEFAKNTREVVRASLVTFGGHELADLRVWVERSCGEPRATRKGLSIRREFLPQLLKAVEALIAAVEAEEASQ
jgi:hypothetical protein